MDYEKYLSFYHGLELWPIAQDDKRFNENGILFYVYFLILKKIDGKLTYSDKIYLRIIVGNLRSFGSYGENIFGLFDRGKGESLWTDKETIKTISHDNLSAIACISYILGGLDYEKEIVHYGKKNCWRFDNVYPEKPRWSRFMHPRDIIYWSYLNKSFWAKFFIWEPMLECIFTCYKKYDTRPLWYQVFWYKITGKKYSKNSFIATSGKLLAFMKLYVLRDKWFGKLTWKICTYFINKNFEGSWKEVFNFYFKNQDHPINLLINKIYKENKELF